MLHFPRAGFVAIRSGSERADRADIDTGSTLVAFEMIAAIGNDFRGNTAIAHAESTHAKPFAADPHAPVAENAARGVIKNDGRPLLLIDMNFLFTETALPRPVAKNHVLQFAFTALIANRTIERMVGQQKFESALARLPDLSRIRMHDHAGGDRECTG